MRGATIAKVAQHAGVGVGTVSRVLNGSPAVSEGTRRRVLDAIDVLDYRPSPVARALSTGRTMAVGVVAPFVTQPSVVERLRGVSRALTAAAYQLILFDVERPEHIRERLSPPALRGRMDGVLYVSLAPDDAQAAQLRGRKGPRRGRRPGASAPAVGNHRRRRGRADGGQPSARAGPPAHRVPR